MAGLDLDAYWNAHNAGTANANRQFTNALNVGAGRMIADGDTPSAVNMLNRFGRVDDAAKLGDEDRKRKAESAIWLARGIRAAAAAGHDPGQAFDVAVQAAPTLGYDAEALKRLRPAFDQGGPAFLDALDAKAKEELQIVEGPNGIYAVGKQTGNSRMVQPYPAPAYKPEWKERKRADGSTEYFDINGGPPQTDLQGTPAFNPAPSGNLGPRNQRNANPGNIEDGPFARSLPGYAGSDGRYAKFNNPDAGRNAQVALLDSYGKRGLNTVAGIINRWAPPSENDTAGYAAFVAKRLGVSPDQPLNMADPRVKAALADAITTFEGGKGGGQQVAQTPSRPGVVQGDAPQGPEWAPDGKGLLINRNGDRKPDPAFAGTPEAGKVTEGERTAGFLSMRLADSLKNLTAISARDPAARRPGTMETLAKSLPYVGSEGAANVVRSADRQEVVTNQLDILDAALTLGTGAAYTKEQLNNYRDTYFPRYTDKPEQIQAKGKKLVSLLRAAQIKAGRSAPPALQEAIDVAEAQMAGAKTATQPAARAPASAPAAAGLPAQARAQIKADHITTFANGQRWTLRNGQPVQVK
jgi:hypothetical protein